MAIGKDLVSVPAVVIDRQPGTARPVVEVFHAWLDLRLPRLPGGSKLAEAIRYALNRWTAPIRFLDDGRIDLDTNPIERAIRPVASGRRNSLFAGSDGGADRWATLASSIKTAKRNDVEPCVWLRDVLIKMVEGHSMQRLDELLPSKAD